MIKLLFPEEFGKAFLPDRIRVSISAHLRKAGISSVPYKLIGWLFYMSLLLSFVAYFWQVHTYISAQPFAISFLALLLFWLFAPFIFFLAFGGIMYVFFDLKIYGRTRKMEKVLPDFLLQVGQNLRAGLPFDQALWSAIRPEFSILADEVSLVSKKVMTGEEITVALKNFSEEYDSPVMRRSFGLIIEAIKGGGHIADVITKMVEDLEETYSLKRAMATANISYIIFISIIVLVIAPALFTFAFQFLLLLINFGNTLGSATAGSELLPINIGDIASFDNPELFRTFSRFALGVLSFFSAMIISQINNGNIKAGLKYIPIFLVISQLVYIALLSVTSRIFGSLIFG